MSAVAACQTEWGRAFIKVTGVRRDRFVEFSFWLNDEDLSVELVMPYPEFQEFCKARQATLVSPDQAARVPFEQLQWRFREPQTDPTPEAKSRQGHDPREDVS